jgi:hypothetical protein
MAGANEKPNEKNEGMKGYAK